MTLRSRKWIVLSLLSLTGCSTFTPSLLEEPFDGDVVDGSFDATATSVNASDSLMDSTVDRRTVVDDVYVPIVDAGNDRKPLDSIDDASVDTETKDAQEDVDSDSEIDAACQGALLFDHCWYLTDADQSCEQFCADHAGFDPNATEYVGSTEQGGSAENCRDVLDALGYSLDVSSANRTDSLGLGCHLWDGTAWWLSSPDFTADSAYPQVRITCACVE